MGLLGRLRCEGETEQNIPNSWHLDKAGNLGGEKQPVLVCEVENYVK